MEAMSRKMRERVEKAVVGAAESLNLAANGIELQSWDGEVVRLTEEHDAFECILICDMGDSDRRFGAMQVSVGLVPNASDTLLRANVRREMFLVVDSMLNRTGKADA